MVLGRLLIKNNRMKLNPKVTVEIAEWLNSDHSRKEDILKGAQLLFRMNNDRYMYGRITRRPEREVKFLEYKLRRFLMMQQDGKTLSDVVRMDRQVSADVQRACDSKPIADDMLPVAAGLDKSAETYIRKGIRPDHDRLPENIQAIWTKNAERWKKVKQLRETLKTLSQPCDRYEYLKILRELWYDYKKEMARYDDYRLDVASASVPDAGTGRQLSEQQLKDLKNADSYVSKNLPVLLQLVEESKADGFDAIGKLENLRQRIQERIDILVSLGRDLSVERKQQLTQCDIKFTTDGQGT